MSAILSGLSNYVDSQKLPLISRLGVESKSAKEFELMTGVVGPTNLNLIESSVNFQNGKSCGWSDSSSTVFTARQLTPAVIKVEQSVCQNAMVDKWMSYELKGKIGANNKDLPFAGQICDELIKQINRKVEDLIWQGDTAGTGDMAFADGIIKLLDATTGATGGAVNVTAATSATIYDRVLAVYRAIPEEAMNDARIYLSLSDFRDLAVELGAKNLFHYQRDVDEKYEMVLPFTDTVVKGMAGLGKTDTIVALVPQHTFYGCDLVSDKDDFKIWYSEDNDEYRIRVAFTTAVQIAYPQEAVINHKAE